MERSEMRAGDTDRQQVAERLRLALNEGRLSLDEYDQRLGSAYAAKTYGDLDGLLTDLPGQRLERVPHAPAAPPAPDPGGRARSPWGWAVWGGWLSVALINIGIWAFASLATGRMIYFWPIWVFGPWGVVLFLSTVDKYGPPTRRRRRRRCGGH